MKMTIHVGLEPSFGELSYYNDVIQSTSNLEIKAVKDDEISKVNLMFNEIKSKINENLGNICILLNISYGNEIRKMFVESGLKAGFKDVQIINWETGFYLKVMSQACYKPLNGNVIWIYRAGYFGVWETINQKAQYIGRWKNESTKIIDIGETVNESILNKEPTFVLYDNTINETILNKLSASCQFFHYHIDGHWYSQACLLKALITTGDPQMAHLNVENFLSSVISLELEETEIDEKYFLLSTISSALVERKIISFKPGCQLPLTFTRKLIKKNNDDVLKIEPENGYTEYLKLPPNPEFYLAFQINTNEIYTVIINGKNDYGTELSSILNPFHIGAKAENATLNFPKYFTIPSKIIAENTKLKATGIDLGTSRCCVAVNRKNGITTVPLDNTGERLLPSYVAYDERNVKCGKVVVNRLRNYSKSTIFDSKRIIGRDITDIEIDDSWPFCLDIDFNRKKIFLQINGFDGNKKVVTAEEVATDLLKYIKQKTEEFQGTKLNQVVITIPASFTESQKVATIEAAKLAGWKTIKLLPEPIAAAFAYFIDRPIPNNSVVLIFDLGGGTLDVCVFKIQNDDQIQILSSTGDSKLGGRNFDTVLIKYFKDILQRKFGILVTKGNKYKLMLDCQRIKEDLSAMANSFVNVDEYDTNKDGEISISLEELQILTQPLLNKLIKAIQFALFNCNYSISQIDKVLQVGGGSRMPMVKNLLRDMFPNAEHTCDTHPDEVVAFGAAYYAYSIFSEK